MFKRIITICIGAGIVLLILGVLWPAAARRITSATVQAIQAVEKGKVRLIGSDPVIKIVDPSAIATVFKDSAPQVKAIFRKAAPESGQLVIEDIIDATNQERIKAGLEPLKVNAQLTKSAKLKTDDMITQQYFEHTSPQGLGVEDLGKKVGYNFVVIGENLALGTFTDSKDLVQAWMDSPGHRANILNPQYQDIGIYAERGMYEGREVWFAVQHFGTGRSACPMIDQTLREKVFTMNADLASQQQAIQDMKGKLEAMDRQDPAFEDDVNKFNAMVNAYNRELATSREYIDAYNGQVVAFNQCLSKYQK